MGKDFPTGWFAHKWLLVIPNVLSETIPLPQPAEPNLRSHN